MTSLFPKPPDVIACKTMKQVKPVRTDNSRFYISEEVYDKEYFPTYCASYFMLYPNTMTRTLVDAYEADPTEQKVHLYTVYLGILAESLEIPFSDSKKTQKFTYSN